MRAGRLDEVIIIHEEDKSIDPDYGSESVDYVPFLQTRADVTYNNGSETIQDHTVANTQAVRFRIRLRDGLKETMQIEWRCNFYNITQIEENRRLRYLLISTSKILN